MGPAVKAPKLRREATQLCCSRSSVRLEPAGQTRLGLTSGWSASWGRAGADQDRTVPSPKEPRVAKSVAEKHIKVSGLHSGEEREEGRELTGIFSLFNWATVSLQSKYAGNTLHNFIQSSFFFIKYVKFAGQNS